MLVSNLVYTRIQEILDDMQVDKVQNKLKQMEYEQACFMFNNTDQCNSFLYSKYPEIKLKSELLSTNINNELSLLDPLKVNVEKFTKNTKDTTSIIGTVIFDIIVRAVEGAGGEEAVVKGLEMVGGAVATVAIIPYALPVLGTALAISKLTASVFSLAVRNDWVDFSSKESDHKRSREDVVKEFSCKVTICSINKFSQLTEEGQKTLAIFFSKYIYYSIKNKDDPYKTVDSFLSNLSNSTHLTALKISKELASTLSMGDGKDMTVESYFSDYSQASCYEDIKLSLAGDVPGDQES